MKTVLAHGCFDILHAGHLAYFEEAKKYGDRLIVSITADRWINKGPGRPYFTAEKRASMVRAIRQVDEVFVVDGPTALPAIERFRPDFYIKGPDYKEMSKDLTGEILNEKRAVEAYGGQLVFTDTEMFSSSAIINRFFQGWSEAQKAQIEAINQLGGIDAIERAIEKLASLNVLVVGEPILDVYRFVNPEGISSKSPTVSCRFQHEEVYEGGSLAIAKHLESFCKVSVYCGTRFPKKIRYIAGTQRVFEVTEIEDSYKPWALEEGGYDAYVVADFGHGLFQGGELDGLKGFVGLNVQTNSSNYGFNLYHKHERYDYLCLDTREARLASHDRASDPFAIARGIHEQGGRLFGFTAGANGAYLFKSNEDYFSPAFSDVVIDATGAGDAYFAITTVLLASDCEPRLVPFIGNVFAGLKTKILGNKSAVSKASLLKAIRGILA